MLRDDLPLAMWREMVSISSLPFSLLLTAAYPHDQQAPWLHLIFDNSSVFFLIFFEDTLVFRFWGVLKGPFLIDHRKGNIFTGWLVLVPWNLLIPKWVIMPKRSVGLRTRLKYVLGYTSIRDGICYKWWQGMLQFVVGYSTYGGRVHKPRYP